MKHHKFLEVYDFDNKFRLGANQDGGYVCANLDTSYDCYISAGVSNEESFSRDFINKYKLDKNNCYAFDGTIIDYPYHYTRDITFIKKNINKHNDDKNTDLNFLLDKYNNIFLKMDIEGGEYPWMLQLDEDKLNKFAQIVIELHNMCNNRTGTNYNDKLTCLEKLAKTHYIVHAHANNYEDLVDGIPNVLELTYVNKKFFDKKPKLNRKPFPIQELDYPNRLDKPDIILDKYPFVDDTNYTLWIGLIIGIIILIMYCLVKYYNML